MFQGDLNHNGFEYKSGLNIDHLPFNPKSRCGGGLYFTDSTNLRQYVHIFGFGWKLGLVQVPEEARIYIEGNKYKADMIHLSKIYDSDDTLVQQLLIDMIPANGMVIRYVEPYNLTPDLCLAAVKQCGVSLGYVPSHMRTPDICLAALKHTGCAARYIPNSIRKNVLNKYYMQAL